MKRYKVIWFDDEFRELGIIREKAILNHIDLVGFDNAKEGIEELMYNLRKYDAAIVDGKFFKHPGQGGTFVDDSAFAEVAKTLLRLNDKKLVPWFILSGQASFTKENNKYADVYKANKVYDKTRDDHLAALWKDLKQEADDQVETQIRHEYDRLFEACGKINHWDDVERTFLDILKSTKESRAFFDDELYFTRLRIIIESMFRAANKAGLLHDRCMNSRDGKVNLTDSFRFLSGLPTKHSGVMCKERHFPEIISQAVERILLITGAASHTTDPDLKNNINLSEYRRALKTNYLLLSLTFQLVDVVLWFKEYLDAHPDKNQNKALWLTVEDNQDGWKTGKVVNRNIKGYAFFKPEGQGPTVFIPPPLVRQFNLSDNTQVQVLIEVFEASDTKEAKTQVKELRIINTNC